MDTEMTVSVEGLRLRGFHGVDPQEGAVGNDFRVDVSVTYPPALRGAATDRLEDTLSYADLVEAARQAMATPSLLLENVAWRLRQILLYRWPAITAGMVRISKLTPPIPGTQMDAASVTIRW